MYLFSWIIISFITLLILNSLGFCFLNNKFFSKKYNNDNIFYVSSIIGFCLIIFFSQFFYFFFNLNVNNIIFIILVFFLISLLINFSKNKILFININYKTYLLTIPVIFFFLLLAEIYKEQFYIFRGNHWDYFYYIKQALNLTYYKFSDFKIGGAHDLEYLLPDKKLIFKQGISYTLNDFFTYWRPALSLFLSIFLKIKFLGLFEIAYGYTVILISLVSVACYFFILKNFNISNIFFPIIFSLSFWVLYIFEISALGVLCSLPVLILFITFSIDIIDELKKKNYGFFFLFAYISVIIFLIYPEIFSFYAIYGILLFLLLFLNNKKILLNKIKFIFFLLISFFILSLVGVKGSYEYLFYFLKEFKGVQEVNFWGYYGAFILGRENLIADLNFVDFLKNQFHTGSLNIIKLIKEVFVSHFQQQYYFMSLNIIPSFFGLYYLAIGKMDSQLSLIWLLFIIILNFFLIKFFFQNIIFVFRNIANKLCLVLASLFLTWVLSTLYLLYKNALWGVIKLYFYFFPIFFIFAFFLLKKNKDKLFFKANKILLILLILFPFYKYSTFNHGIGSKDSFPSILYSQQKEGHAWKINREELNSCSKVLIDISADKDSIPKIFYLKLLLDYDKINYLYSFNKNLSYDCQIIIKDNSFRILNIKL